jgi:hypothetical protein
MATLSLKSRANDVEMRSGCYGGKIFEFFANFGRDMVRWHLEPHRLNPITR